MTEAEFNAKQDELREDLADPYLGFLVKLVKAAKVYGHSGDWPAVKDFVLWCHEESGEGIVDLEPYMVD